MIVTRRTDPTISATAPGWYSVGIEGGVALRFRTVLHKAITLGQYINYAIVHLLYLVCKYQYIIVGCRIVGGGIALLSGIILNYGCLERGGCRRTSPRSWSAGRGPSPTCAPRSRYATVCARASPGSRAACGCGYRARRRETSRAAGSRSRRRHAASGERTPRARW